jgi:hypothetical protein
MSKTRMVLLRIVGGVVGLLIGSVLLAWAAIAVVCAVAKVEGEFQLMVAIYCGPPGALVGATVGAAAGANISQKILREQTRLWKSLVGSGAGLLFGGLPAALLSWGLYDCGIWHHESAGYLVPIAFACAAIVVGAVIGSEWESRPVHTPSTGR